MCQWCSSATWQDLHAATGTSNRRSWLDQHLRRDAAAGNQGHLVSVLVCVLQQAQHSALGILHAVQCHGTTGINHEDHEGTCLTSHLLHPNVAALDVNISQLLWLALLGGFLSPHLLIHHGVSQRRIQRNLPAFGIATLWKHGLHITPTVHRVNLVSLSTSATLLLLALKLEQIRINNGAFGVDHELFRHIGILIFLVFVLVRLIIFLLVLLLLLLVLWRRRHVLRIHVVLWGRRRWRWWLLLFLNLLLHLGFLDSDTRQNSQLDGLLQVVSVALIPAFQGRVGPGDLHREDLPAVALAAATARLLREAQLLVLRDGHIIEKLAGKQELSLHGRNVSTAFFKGRRRPLREVEGRHRCGHAVVQVRVNRVHIRVQRDCQSVQQVWAQRPFLWVPGGYHQWPTRVRH
mmetsp:Transcript_597/g.1217  ORF Transcript_597/g.1217 Transcript_597/m.1217 type:complete len:405 (-) Transcript_597:817-2031(-)